jgi:hypothetical protein
VSDTSTTSSGLDPLGLADIPPPSRVRIGGVDVSAAIRSGHATTAVSTLPVASFTLDLDLLSPDPVDLLAEVTLDRIVGPAHVRRFTGVVVTAYAAGHQLTIEARSGTAFTESVIPGLTQRGVPGFEIIHLLGRMSGLRDDQMRIDGMDTLPREVFEVVVAVTGLQISQPIQVGTVRLLPAPAGLRILDGLPTAAFDRPFRSAPCHAVVLCTAHRAVDAEEEGLQEVRTALAWIAVRVRYGLLLLPDETVQSFTRQDARSLPQAADLVAIHGLRSGRTWLRVAGEASRAPILALEGSPHLMQPPLPSMLTLQDRQALLACRRAAAEPDPLVRVQALWEAIEFYVAGARVPPLFTREQLSALRNAIPAGLSNEQRQRVLDKIGELNDPSLMKRLHAVLDTENAPITDAEIALLRRLRDLRNDAVHGRSTALPDQEDVKYATSVVSRMLIFHIYNTLIINQPTPDL